MTFSERDAGRLIHVSSDDPSELNEHPAIVVSVSPAGSCVVMMGTRTPRDRTGRILEPHEVPPEDARPDEKVFWVEAAKRTGDDGNVLRLHQRTYFHAGPKGRWVAPNPRMEVFGSVSVRLYMELRKMLGYRP